MADQSPINRASTGTQVLMRHWSSTLNWCVGSIDELLMGYCWWILDELLQLNWSCIDHTRSAKSVFIVFCCDEVPWGHMKWRPMQSKICNAALFFLVLWCQCYKQNSGCLFEWIERQSAMGAWTHISPHGAMAMVMSATAGGWCLIDAVLIFGLMLSWCKHQFLNNTELMVDWYCARGSIRHQCSINALDQHHNNPLSMMQQWAELIRRFWCVAA